MDHHSDSAYAWFGGVFGIGVIVFAIVFVGIFYFFNTQDAVILLSGGFVAGLISVGEHASRIHEDMDDAKTMEEKAYLQRLLLIRYGISGTLALATLIVVFAT